MPKRTKSGKKTAVADVEEKLKKEYPGNPGAVFGTLNKIGLKQGSKTTPKGMKPAKMSKPSMMPKKAKGMSDISRLKKMRMPA